MFELWSCGVWRIVVLPGSLQQIMEEIQYFETNKYWLGCCLCRRWVLRTYGNCGPFMEFISEPEGGLNPVACQKSKVYGLIVVTRNSTPELGTWIILGIISISLQLQIISSHFENFYNGDAKAISQSEYSLRLMSDHIHPSQFVSTSEPRVVSTFWAKSNLLCGMCLFCICL